MTGINENAGWDFLNFYAPNTVIKPIPITFPLCYDEMGGEVGQMFVAYAVGLRPSMFLIDQVGQIRLRYDGASSAEQFLPHLEEIKSMIAELLANPPTG